MATNKPRKSAKNIVPDPSELPPEPTESKAVVVIECPPELSPVARKEWDRIIPQLAAADRLTGLDRGPLAVYCTAFAAWLEAVTALQTYGTIMKSPSGYPMQSPYVSIASKNAEIIIRIAAEFGFTPASRMRLPRPSKGGSSLLDIPSLDDWASELTTLG